MRYKLAIIDDELIESDPHLKRATFPDFIDNEAISDVTFGLDSYIARIIPIGVEILLIFNPLSLAAL